MFAAITMKRDERKYRKNIPKVTKGLGDKLDEIMGTTPAFLNIHEGKVVASTVKKPKIRYIELVFSVLYDMRLGSWQYTILGKAENATRIVDSNNILIKHPNKFVSTILGIAEPNQPCQVKVGKKVTVIKI